MNTVLQLVDDDDAHCPAVDDNDEHCPAADGGR